LTSRRITLRSQGWAAVAAGLLLAAGTALASPSGDAPADGARSANADSARAGKLSGDSARAAPPPARAPDPAWIAVETKPSGLRIRIGEVEAGWSPLRPFRVPSGRVTVRAFPTDPRRFDPVTDGVTLDAAPGETIRVALDLRPHPLLLSQPVASVWLLPTAPEHPDSSVGETPLRLAPAILESHRVRFTAYGYADSVVPGPLLLAASGRDYESARVELRFLHLPPPPPPPPPSLFGRRWFQWTLIGAGTLLTGGASIFRREANRSYDRYLDATNPRVIEREYDRTVRYDRWAAGTLGGGQVLLTAGLFFLVTGVGR